MKVLAFGIVKEIFGRPVTDLSVEGLTAGELKANLEHQYPRLKQLSSFMIAVNSEYATPATLIKPGDEVAIIPPVSGG